MGADHTLGADACALGSLPDARPWLSAGPYRYIPPQGPTLLAAGEITLFNRAELLALLADWPINPTCSDGELLLALYVRHGLAVFGQVEGMFALAMWDGAALTLVRDPVGARTLFYTRSCGQWAAASTLHALRRMPAFRARLNLAAVQAFLTFAYLPGAETLLADVYELLPGQYVRLCENGTQSTGFYWLPAEPDPAPAIPPEQHIAELRRQLEATTAAMVPKGEDVGVLLSGGVDSSLVTALAARLYDRPVRTYSINFGADLPNELAYSGLVANHCRTRHQVLTFSGAQVAEHLAEAVALLDCPVGDPLTVPNLLLARAAAADGLRVILNGEGGDPCFGGPKNVPMILDELQRSTLNPQARARAYLHSYRKCYSELPRLLSPAVQHALAAAPPLEARVQPYLEAPQMRSYLNRLLLTNVRTKGAHHILTKVERLTAACGIEGRAPLFSRAVVAQSFVIPPELKLFGTVEKWALKQAVADLLPAQIIERPKSGMRVPVQHWLRGPLRDLAADTLLGPRAQARGLFQPATIKAWLRGEGMAWPRHGIALWMLVTLELWLRAYLDGDSV
jgi:asparagine synthase (glutamine-hydrolysing)